MKFTDLECVDTPLADIEVGFVVSAKSCEFWPRNPRKGMKVESVDSQTSSVEEENSTT